MFQKKFKKSAGVSQRAFKASVEGLEKREVCDVSAVVANNIMTVRITRTTGGQNFTLSSNVVGNTLSYGDGLKGNIPITNRNTGRQATAGDVRKIEIYGSEGPNVIDLKSVTGSRGFSSSYLDVPGKITIITYGGEDKVLGSPYADDINTGSGNDLVYGFAGNDRIWGGDGNNTLIGHEGNDQFYDGVGKDNVSCGSGDDYVAATNPLPDSRFDGGSSRENNVYVGPRSSRFKVLNFRPATSALVSQTVSREQLLTDPAVFDAELYLLIYPDLEAAFGRGNFQAAKDHWLNYGVREGRRASIAYEPNWYLASNPDLMDVYSSSGFEGLLKHFMDYGIMEGRQASREFDVNFYLTNHIDLMNAFGDGNYRTAISHFVNYGMFEGRNTSLQVSMQAYYGRYSDLQAVIGPNYRGLWIHWLRHGVYEGRDPRP